MLSFGLCRSLERKAESPIFLKWRSSLGPSAQLNRSGHWVECWVVMDRGPSGKILRSRFFDVVEHKKVVQAYAHDFGWS